MKVKSLTRIQKKQKIITFHLVVGIIFYLAMLIFVYLIFFA